MKVWILCLSVLLSSSSALAEDRLLIASGAGYKTVLEALVSAYGKHGGTPVERIYGNMAQILSQAQTSGKVDLLLGEKDVLLSSPLGLSTVVVLGQGRLVLAWSKAGATKTALSNPAVRRIALPDDKRTIYGKAAMEYLIRSKQLDEIRPKLLITGTVPQVFSYLVSGEVDAGFLNLTQALALKERLGGHEILPPDLYDPIQIILACPNTPEAKRSTQRFLSFLASDTAREILTAHGL